VDHWDQAIVVGRGWSRPHLRVLIGLELEHPFQTESSVPDIVRFVSNLSNFFWISGDNPS